MRKNLTYRLTFSLFIVTSLCFLCLSPAFSANSASPKLDLESEWLFQCKNEPTFDKVKQEITWAREMADRISKLENADTEKISKLVDELGAVEKKLADGKETTEKATDLYLKVRDTKRKIAFSNPLVDFSQVILIDNPYPKGKPGDATDEWGHEARHRNGFMAEPGGKMLVVDLDGNVVRDLLEGIEGSFWRPDVSYEGDSVLFSFQPKGEKSFHIYKVNIDGSGLKQLTYGDYDDLDPIFTPEGKIIFCSSRQHSYVRCMPMTHSFAVSRCDADGKNIYVISANGEPEYLPSMLNDGRVIFTRWEYTDKALWRVQSLWTMNPDGTNTSTFWGNQSVWPDVLTEARAIPNSRRVMFTGVGHHAWFNGSIGIIDP
ncbi:MAG: TolB family protein, partial [Thermoguttaceae bacterium]